MTDQIPSNVIKDNPIGNSLDAFRASFDSICHDRSIARSSMAIDQLAQDDLRNLTLPFLSALQGLSVAGLLVSRTNAGTLRNDLLRLIVAVASDDFDFGRIKPLLKEALADKPQDILIWRLVSTATVQSTPPPRPIPSSIQQTPWTQNTSSFVNSSEFRDNVDPVLKLEAKNFYAGLPDFHKTFFGDVPDLDTVSEAVFGRCTGGENPLFQEGWSGWPPGAKESDVLTWFRGLIPDLEAFAGDCFSTPAPGRKLLTQPRTPLVGSTAKRSMDIGFINSDITYNPDSEDPRYCWSDVLVAGELKSNPKADNAWTAWIDLARYAREVFKAQPTRRFVLGFTLCGSLMRVWEFDRLGGVASEQFDINKKDGGLQFVTTILGFLWMNKDGHGFDPTIITSDGKQYIEIKRDGQTQRLIIDDVMKRAPCIAGRATTCWKAHCKEDPQTPLVIKDSWQYTDRDEEGILLQEATEKGVVNVARYYHHETVRIHGADDDVQSNIRKGLDITKATKGRPALPSSASAPSDSHKGQSSSTGMKRPSSNIDAALPPSKRPRLATPTKASIEVLSNRVHRRVILRDYGKPIYEASSCVALLAALEGCIKGHESLYNAGFLHRDISGNNLMINEDDENPSRRAFLIDLDLAIKVQRDSTSGARGMTGTKAFMAIGALLGEQHSFMHDLESFFWVIFWICIHSKGPNESQIVPRFERWNYENRAELASFKKAVIDDEGDFLEIMDEYFTPYFRGLIPWINKLRRKVFPNGGRWKKENHKLYSEMEKILREAGENLVVSENTSRQGLDGQN
ncbi:serine/threonine-protein kinase Sgk2 [Diaporthe sp. PMI_573]|nr:serine/threonine-protein kinase Sgk2 [Diaporthaceae sp. PMI_573]